MKPVDPAEISALLDGELSPERTEQVRRAIAEDSQLRCVFEQSVGRTQGPDSLRGSREVPTSDLAGEKHEVSGCWCRRLRRGDAGPSLDGQARSVGRGRRLSGRRAGACSLVDVLLSAPLCP